MEMGSYGGGSGEGCSLCDLLFLSQRTAAHSSSRRVLLAVSVSLIITTYITAICLIEVGMGLIAA